VGARWLVELGEASRFWPADEALVKLGTAAEVIYEA
jgi:DNA polymerase-3 subunit alpha